jgi:hypothetical protein
MAALPNLARRPSSSSFRDCMSANRGSGEQRDGIDLTNLDQPLGPDAGPRSVTWSTTWTRSKREVHYALCDDRRTLLWLANQRAVEYHPDAKSPPIPPRSRNCPGRCAEAAATSVWRPH